MKALSALLVFGSIGALVGVALYKRKHAKTEPTPEQDHSWTTPSNPDAPTITLEPTQIVEP